MSFKFYNKLWIATKKDLEDVLFREKLLEKVKATKDRAVAHNILADLYPRYVELCNNLGDIYDQTLSVQKLDVVEKLLVKATTRLQEFHKKLTEAEMSEIIYLDRTLIERKMISQDLVLLRPFYFPMIRSKEIQDLIDGVKKVEVVEEQPLKGLDRFRKRYTPEELEEQRKRKVISDAIIEIQKHERARKTRILYNYIKLYPEKYKPKARPVPDSLAYDFYHKSDTVMLFPIKRTVYEGNFYLEVTNFDDFEFYKKPEVVIQDTPQFGRKKQKKIDQIKVVVEKDLEAEKQEELTQQRLAEEEKKRKQAELEEQILQISIQHIAAYRIQLAWKKLIERRKLKEQYQKKLLTFNMVDSRKWDFTREEVLKAARERRRVKKKLYIELFKQACEDEKARILRVKGPWLMEDISDHIREWFREFYKEAGDFDRYPETFEGGTILVIRGETATPEEFKEQINMTKEQKEKLKQAKKVEKEKEKAKIRKEKEKYKKELKKRREREKSGQFLMEFQIKFPQDRSKALTELEQALEKYNQDWRFIDESKNPKESPITEWITIDKYAEVHQELRPTVDEFMRLEFELLRQALAKDLKKKYKPQKKKKEKKKKGEKKGKKKKGAIDLLQENSKEDLFNELVERGIIVKYQKCKLDDFIGDLNYRAFEARQEILDPLHGYEELKQAIRMCILGMGPLGLTKPKSVLLAGPPKCGKKFLIHAICSETNAVLFDLSPEKVAAFNDMKYFVALITQMAKILEPTILMIDGGHKPFYKKIPKMEKELDPKKLGKVLLKQILKPIKQEDKIMLIGASNEPWNSALGKMKKCYEKIFLLPRTDYGNAFKTWRHELLNLLGIPRNLDISPLTWTTRGFSTGEIIECVKNTLDIRRRMQFLRKPLNIEELLEYFLSKDPPQFPKTPEEFEKFLKWYQKANKLAKLRAEAVKEAHPPEAIK